MLTTCDSHTCRMPACVQHSHRAIQSLYSAVVQDLFCEMQLTNHCLHSLLPQDKTLSHMLRAKGHAFQLPTCMYNLHRNHLSLVVCLSFSLIVFFMIFDFIYYSCFTIVNIVF